MLYHIPVITRLSLTLPSGGYDKQEPDNVHTLTMLRNLCSDLGLTHHTLETASSDPAPPHTQVIFLLNFSMAQRSYLLTTSNTLALLYTPSNEHFGIVPLEAMACGLPVLAVNSGGPTETVVDLSKPNGTGFLRPPDEMEWSKALKQLIIMPEDQRNKVAETAKQRIQDGFSSKTLGKEMEAACIEAIALHGGQLVRDEVGDKMILWGAGLVAGAVVGFAIIWATVGL